MINICEPVRHPAKSKRGRQYPRSRARRFARPPGGLDAAQVRKLSVFILGFPTVTEALQGWCARNGLVFGKITPELDKRHIQERAPDDAFDRLRLLPNERIDQRRLRVTGYDLTLSEETTWFVPERLSPFARLAMRTTNQNVCEAMRDLDASRRVYFASILDEKGNVADLHPAAVVLEHRSIISDGRRIPLAIVSERYFASLLR